MATEKPLSRRVDFFYLVDSILNKCARETHRGGQQGGRPAFDAAVVQRHASGYPVLVAAGLPQAVTGLLEVPEGPDKLLKVLGLWRSNNLLAQGVVDPVMARVTACVAQREEAARAKRQGELQKQQQAAQAEAARKVVGCHLGTITRSTHMRSTIMCIFTTSKNTSSATTHTHI